jgi:hypothetical protein
MQLLQPYVFIPSSQQYASWQTTKPYSLRGILLTELFHSSMNWLTSHRYKFQSTKWYNSNKIYCIIHNESVRLYWLSLIPLRLFFSYDAVSLTDYWPGQMIMMKWKAFGRLRSCSNWGSISSVYLKRPRKTIKIAVTSGVPAGMS